MILAFIHKLSAIVGFFLFYLKEVLLSNVRVAYDVLTPRSLMDPAIIPVSIEGLNDRQTFALANLISMTPGTLTLELDHEQQCLWIHAMYADNPEETKRDLEIEFKERICRVF